ncbi:hypothetical protein [Deinococcus arcticus]|uniref:hypothetical protein n=1 Tax=Deinococcus arcticus TaxID=2136176 RepID=UPI0018EDE4F3|nr:hypothetical protein [Deinococcus arcticus]
MSDTENTSATQLAPPVPTAYAAAVLNFLTDEGFRPKLDDDGDVHFKYEGGTYFVLTAGNDPTHLALLYPFFWPLEDAAERARALEAAMHAQRQVRVGRILVLEHDVSANVSAYLPDEQSFRAVLLRSLEGLKYLVLKFQEHMRAQLEN